MPSRDWRLRIQDILDCIEKISRYTEGMDFDNFSRDEKTVDAVVRNLEIIGEAACHVPEELCERYSSLPWSKMRGMRNILAHDYTGVSLPIVWTTIKEDLPPLVSPLQGILQSDT